jgi:hypothetical protein
MTSGDSNSMADRIERATAHAIDAGDTDAATTMIKRASASSTRCSALYSVEDRRCSGEWRIVAEFIDPKMAQQVAALLRSAGGVVRVELIPQPIVP